MFYRKRRYQRKGKRVARKGTRKPKVSAPIRRYVRSAIHRQIENKKWVDYSLNNTITTASASFPSYTNLMPVIAQGTGQMGRIGNKINVRRAMVKGFVNLLPYNATTNPKVGPLMVKIWVCTSKKYHTHLITSTAIDSNFFETGNGSYGFSGSLLDNMFKNNDSEWKIHATKQFELGASSWGGVSSTYNPISNDNSRFIQPFYFNLTKALKKNLLYNDNTSSYCTNQSLFLVFQAVYADGTSTAVQAAEFHHTVEVEYEDA